jgi:hypothetical protein
LENTFEARNVYQKNNKLVSLVYLRNDSQIFLLN